MKHFLLIASCFAILISAFEIAEDFDPQKFKGKWWEQARSKNAFFELGEYVEANYKLRKEGGFNIDQASIQPNGMRRRVKAIADPVGDSPNHFLFWYPDSWFSRWTKADFRILATDYKNYAIIFSLNRVLGMDWKFAWILTRKRVVDNKCMDKLFDEVAQRTGFQKYQMHRTLQ